MDIRALSQLTGATTASASAVAVPVDSRALISDIASSTTLTDVERTGLIAAVAQIDSGLSGVARTDALSQVEGLGIYLRNSGTDGYPRWPMMTALRAYGLNLTNGGSGSSNQAAVISNLKSNLEQLAQGHSVSLQKAIAATSSLPVAHVYNPPVKVVTPAPAVPVVDTPAADVGTRIETTA